MELNSMVAVCVGVLSLVTLTLAHYPCDDPHDLHQQWATHVKESSRHEHGSGPKFYTGITGEPLLGPERYLNPYQAARNPACTSKKPLSPLQEKRAYCPWENEVSRDATRYPFELVEARCSCHYGVGMQGNRHACEHIFYNVPVMRKTGHCDRRGRYVYKRDFERLSVGCTTTYV